MASPVKKFLNTPDKIHKVQIEETTSNSADSNSMLPAHLKVIAYS